MPDTAPEVATQMVLTDIVERRYENLEPEERESVRQHLAAHMNILTLARKEAKKGFAEAQETFTGAKPDDDDTPDAMPNTLMEMVKKFINVREIDMELIDSVNTFQERFEVASKSLDSTLLSQMQSAMVALRVNTSGDEARTLWPRIKAFPRADGPRAECPCRGPAGKAHGRGLGLAQDRKGAPDA